MSAEQLEERKNSAFISYSRRDIDFVRRLVKAFNDDQRDVWIDWEDIPPTADWWQEIQDGIDGANDFVFIISPDSVASDVCQRELAYAVSHNKRLVPLLYRDVPDYKNIHEKLSSHNWIIFKDRDFDTVFQALLEALDTDLEHIRAHTRLLTRAIEWEKKDRSPNLVLRGQDLEDYAHWWAQSTDKTPRPTAIQVDYITTSQQIADARRRMWFSLMTIGLALTVTLMLFAVYQTYQANIAQERAEWERMNAQSLLLSDNASRASALDNNSHLALVLALAANRVGDPPPAQSQRGLSEIAYSPGLRNHFTGHTKQVTGVDISPNGLYGLSGSLDGTSLFFNAETGELIQKFTHPEAMPIQSVALNPANPQIALAGLLDWSIVMWNTTTGEEIKRLGGIRTDIGHRGAVTAVKFSPDGKQIISGSSDTTLILWETETGNILRVFGDSTAEVQHTGTVNAVAFNPNGLYVASGSDDSNAIIWNLGTGRGTPLTRHRGAVLGVSFSSTGARVITTSQDQTMIEWNTRSGQLIQTYGGVGDSGGHTGAIRAVVYKPGESEIITAGDDGNIVLWYSKDNNTTSAGYPHHQLREINPSTAPRSIAITRDGRRLISGTNRGTVSIWDVTNEAIVQYFIDGHQAAITAVDYHPDGEQVVTVGLDFTGIIWSVDNGDIMATLDGHEGRLNTARYSPDGTQIATGADDGTVILWEAESGEFLTQFQLSDRAGITVLEFTTDGTGIIAALDDGTLGLWDSASGERLQTYRGHLRRVSSISVSPDRVHFASGSVDGHIIIWDIAEGVTAVSGFGHIYFDGTNSRVLSLTYHPDGDILLSGALDGWIMKWDARTGKELDEFQSGDNLAIWSMRYSPNGQYVVSGDGAGNVTLWSSETGEALREFREHTGAVQGVAFSPDGRFVLSGGRDTSALLWDMPSLEQLLTWTIANRHLITLSCPEQVRYQLVSEECASSQLHQQISVQVTLPAEAELHAADE